MGDRTKESALGILAMSPVFQAAPSSDLERLAPRCLWERYRKGAEIIRRGAPGDSLGVVGKGRVKVVLPSPDGEAEFIIAMFWPGDVFGEIAAFEQPAYVASTIAITETEIAFVPRVELIALLERRPAVAIRLLEAVSSKLRTACDLSLSMRFLDVPSRFYQRLLYLARFESQRTGSSLVIQHGLSQQELADSIGASREALNKVISDWKKAGLIEWGRGHVIVHDPSLLAERMPAAIRNSFSADRRSEAGAL
ncbi:MAG TPA: Crp/Fnr family transcriptional regulator [Candidatus Limnocylindrales bacterium]|nr:Crp/Fnr family transcriptional regulator [Candidatus Limnocylindrales bacterium]